MLFSGIILKINPILFMLGELFLLLKILFTIALGD